MAITVAQVRQIAKLPTDVAVLPDANVQNYIDAANVVMADLVGKGLAAERLDLINLYLAAHFAVLTEEHGGFAAQTVGDSEERYISEGKDGLAQTRFGQQAISLDPTGTLAKQAAKPLPAQFRVISDPCVEVS